MASQSISAAVTALLLGTLLICIKAVEAQPSPPSCISNLVPCASYLNSTKPPASCCSPLKEAVTHQLDCLCKLYENPELLKSFNINVTQALALPSFCGIPGSVSACKALAPGSSSSSNQPPAKVTPSGNESNGAYNVACAGFSSILLLVLGASMMLW